jgi:prophage regulatory protein
MAHAIKTLAPRGVCEKFSRKKSWLWDRLKNDPEFPKPIYLGPGAPVFIESELDEYLLSRARAPTIQRQIKGQPPLKNKGQRTGKGSGAK